jgi:hypothetical protein
MGRQTAIEREAQKELSNDGVDPPDGVDLRMPNPLAAVEAVIERLLDAGFVIKDAE